MIPLEDRSTAACWILELYDSYIVRGINGIILIFLRGLMVYVISHLCWGGGERNTIYKGVETFP